MPTGCAAALDSGSAAYRKAARARLTQAHVSETLSRRAAGQPRLVLSAERKGWATQGRADD
eukprot:2620226-Pleurochrysis_carterae.AAC.4